MFGPVSINSGPVSNSNTGNAISNNTCHVSTNSGATISNNVGPMSTNCSTTTTPLNTSHSVSNNSTKKALKRSLAATIPKYVSAIPKESIQTYVTSSGLEVNYAITDGNLSPQSPKYYPQTPPSPGYFPYSPKSDQGSSPQYRPPSKNQSSIKSGSEDNEEEDQDQQQLINSSEILSGYNCERKLFHFIW